MKDSDMDSFDTFVDQADSGSDIIIIPIYSVTE